MSKWARKNELDQIVEITEVNPEGRFHPEIVWVEVAENAVVYNVEELFESPAPQGPALTAEEQAEADALREAADAALAARLED